MDKLNRAVWIAGYILSAVVTVVVAVRVGRAIGIDDQSWWVYAPYYLGLVFAFIGIMAMILGMSNGGDLWGEEMLFGWKGGVRPPFIGLSMGFVDRTFAPIAAYFTLIMSLAFSGGIAVMILVLIFPILVSLAVMVVFTAVFALYMIAADVVYLYILAIARLADASGYKANTRMFVCPQCGKMAKRPHYYANIVPVESLRPSIYGILHTQINGAEVPCFGSRRASVTQICPECRTGANLKESKPFVVTMAGAPDSGKSAFLYTVLAHLAHTKGNGMIEDSGLAHSEDLRDYRTHISGARVQTPLDWRPPSMMYMEVKGMRNDRMLFMYDVNGSFFTDSGNTQDIQVQYPFNDGIVLTVDPTAHNPGKLAFDHYNGFILKYREYCQIPVGRRVKVPLAVVSTRADIAGFDFRDKDSAGVRSSLERLGFGELIAVLERDFSDVSYFSCIARGADRSVSRPMAWLCGKCPECDIGKLF